MSRILKPYIGTPIDWANPITNGLKHYWSFQENGGSLIRDLVGGRHGTATNVTPATAWVQTTRGAALDFDGTNDYVTCPTISTLSSASKFSILMWADRRVAGTRVGVGNWSGAYSNLVDFLLEPDGIYLEVYTGGFPYGFVAHDQVGLKAYLMVFDGSQSTNAGKLKLYIDGAPITLSYADTVPTASAANSSPWEMGRAQGAYYSGGLLEEVMIWNRAITPSEAIALAVDPNLLFRTRRRLAKAPAAGGTVTGTLNATLPNLTSSSTGQVAIAASATPTIAAPTLSASGVVAVAGTATPTIGAPTLVSAGTAAVAGSANATLGNLSCSSTAAVTVTATTNATLPNLSLSSDGTVTSPDSRTASLDATLPNLSSSSSGAVAVAGAVAVTLGNLTLGSAAAVTVTAALSATLGNVTVTATGIVGDVPEVISDTPITGFFRSNTLAAELGDVAKLGANWRHEQIEASF